VAYPDLTDADTALTDRKAMASSTTVLVSRRESFNAAHQLRDPDLSEDENQRLFGKCANLHGHNYVLEVVVAGEIDQATGYVVDLKQLSNVICRRIIDDVDHRNLNTDVLWLDGRIPTAENLALAFWERINSELPDGQLRTLLTLETPVPKEKLESVLVYGGFPLSAEDVVDGVTKTTEGSRPGNFSAVRQAIARGSGKGSFGLRYTSAQGDYAIDSDASLTTALKDAEARRQPFLRVVVGA